MAEVLGYDNMSFVEGFAEDLAAAGIEDGSVDVVIANCTINHSPCKELILAEIWRVLKEGGELYLTTIFSDRRITAELQVPLPCDSWVEKCEWTYNDVGQVKAATMCKSTKELSRVQLSYDSLGSVSKVVGWTYVEEGSGSAVRHDFEASNVVEKLSSSAYGVNKTTVVNAASLNDTVLYAYDKDRNLTSVASSGAHPWSVQATYNTTFKYPTRVVLDAGDGSEAVALVPTYDGSSKLAVDRRTNVCYTGACWGCEREGVPVADKVYICIDLKSFYASVECADRGLDPFKDNLVVADPDRTEKTICLAITPAMKALGVRNRCRVFEIPPGISYVKAKPRMRRYMEASADIYSIYLRYVSPDDVHVYSIDECFIDATPYLTLYGTDARSFARELMGAVQRDMGICATAGIGTNLFLAKVALDVTAKHAPDNIGFLDEASFRRDVWLHRPITDIWGIGPGIARRLAKYGAFDLAGVAAMNPKTLYREFGANAEFLIDHAWGQEPCTIADIKAYEPEGRSITNGQVLPCDYSFEEARMVMLEMVDASVLELVERRLAASSISLGVGYARPRGVSRGELFDGGHGWRPVGGSRWGEHTGGSRRLGRRTNSARLLKRQFQKLFDETTRRGAPVRRLNIGFGDLVSEELATFTLFDDMEVEAKERDLQRTLVAVRGKFGKNAMLKAASLQDKATARERNEQVGGHHA